MERKKILLVDDSAVNLAACEKTLKDLYDVYPVTSADNMFKLLEKITPDLFLLDVEMPSMNGYDAMRKLKELEIYKDIPVIFLSAMDDAESELEGLDLGAVDYIHKPFISSLLHKRIETHLSIIDGRKELHKLNKSIEELLKPQNKGEHIKLEAEDEAVSELLEKNRLFDKICRDVSQSVDSILEMLEAGIKSKELANARYYMGRVDAEMRFVKESLDGVIDEE